MAAKITYLFTNDSKKYKELAIFEFTKDTDGTETSRAVFYAMVARYSSITAELDDTIVPWAGSVFKRYAIGDRFEGDDYDRRKLVRLNDHKGHVYDIASWH